jgi:hypothetical protein
VSYYYFVAFLALGFFAFTLTSLDSSETSSLTTFVFFFDSTSPNSTKIELVLFLIGCHIIILLLF